MTEKFLVFDRGLVHALDRFAGNDKDVDGRLRVGITKGDALVVFVDDSGGDFAVDDFGEDGVGHGSRFATKERKSHRKNVLSLSSHKIYPPAVWRVRETTRTISV